MNKRIVVQVTVWQEDDETYKRVLEWHARRVYQSDELNQLRCSPARVVIDDLQPDIYTMMDKVLA